MFVAADFDLVFLPLGLSLGQGFEYGCSQLGLQSQQWHQELRHLELEDFAPERCSKVLLRRLLPLVHQLLLKDIPDLRWCGLLAFSCFPLTPLERPLAHQSPTLIHQVVLTRSPSYPCLLEVPRPLHHLDLLALRLAASQSAA